nr:MAG TPA: hypothetical protein [Crassvirales sp.]
MSDSHTLLCTICLAGSSSSTRGSLLHLPPTPLCLVDLVVLM